jgi:hypothetical protein
MLCSFITGSTKVSQVVPTRTDNSSAYTPIGDYVVSILEFDKAPWSVESAEDV